MRTILAASAAITVSVVWAGAASASTCIGVCGVLGADGVVTTSPQGGVYQYVTTTGGEYGEGQIDGVGGANGSLYVTDGFSANPGAQLEFYFNYVTSDGSGYSDYAWSELQTLAGGHVAWIFTARTKPVGDVSPGFDLPANDAALTPATSPIINGPVTWSPLEPNDSPCYMEGCGYTGWIKSTYTIAGAGNYRLAFGVSNYYDSRWNSGLAFDGIVIDGVAVPEPATWALMIGGFGLAGAALRHRRMVAA